MTVELSISLRPSRVNDMFFIASMGGYVAVLRAQVNGLGIRGFTGLLPHVSCAPDT